MEIISLDGGRLSHNNFARDFENTFEHADKWYMHKAEYVPKNYLS